MGRLTLFNFVMVRKPKFKKARYCTVRNKDLVSHIEIFTDDGILRIDPWDNKTICVTHQDLPSEEEKST